MTAQTVPSKAERNDLLRVVQSITGCSEEQAALAIRTVLTVWGVKAATPKEQKRGKKSVDKWNGRRLHSVVLDEAANFGQNEGESE